MIRFRQNEAQGLCLLAKLRALTGNALQQSAALQVQLT